MKTVTIVSLLKDRGLPDDEADLWASMICSCLEYIHEANIMLIKGWQKFERKIKINTTRKAIKKIKDGKSPSDLILLQPEETDITYELYENMKKIRTDKPLGESLRNILPKCDDPVTSEIRTGKRAKRADLTFTLFSITGYEIVFEAKSLRNGSSVSAYVGLEGIGCFTNIDSPYTQAPVAGMLGYAYCDSRDMWISKITEKHQTMIHTDLEMLSEDATKTYSIEERTKLNLMELTLLHKILDFTEYIDSSAHPLKSFVEK